MDFIGALFLVLALMIAITVFIGRPLFQRTPSLERNMAGASDTLEHRRSALMAERDRVLNALQELEFDYTLGKIPAEDYPVQRMQLMQRGSSVLRQLDEIQPEVDQNQSVEDRIEAAVASRRADAMHHKVGVAQPQPVAVGAVDHQPILVKDDMEDLIASRRRQRQEKAGGFCPRCGRPVLKSDKFCSKCGATL